MVKPEELNKILLENRRMRMALEFIAEWKLPQVYCRAAGKNTSYEYAMGSNGVRDFIKGFAKEALKDD